MTGPHTGTVNYSECMKHCGAGGRIGLAADRDESAVHCGRTHHGQGGGGRRRGRQPPTQRAGQSRNPRGQGTAGKENNINVVLVADIDWIAPVIFFVREMGEREEMQVDWKFQNVTFVLNMLDSLAGDDRFVDFRKRTRPHRILTKIEEATDDYRKESLDKETTFINAAGQQIDAVKEEFRKKIDELENRKDLDPRVQAQVVEMQRIQSERARDVKIASSGKGSRSASQAERTRAVGEDPRRTEFLQAGCRDFAADPADLAGVFRVLPSPPGRARRRRQSATSLRQEERRGVNNFDRITGFAGSTGSELH